MTEIIVTRLRPNKILVTSPGPQGPGGGTGEGVQDWFNVRDYGAAGNGVTDDHAAIMSCIASAGRGAVIYFPRGHYLVSRPVVPMRQQTLLGVYATKYQAGEWPSFYADCAIIAAPGFVGDVVIEAAPTSFGVHVIKLAIIGPGHNSSNPTVAGVRFPEFADNIGETAWLMRDVLINSCPGPGITGRMWVIDLRDTHISNCGYGILVDGQNRINDARIIGCNIYFNRRGGIVLDGQTRSGAVEIIGTRIERSGNKYGYPDQPVHTNAPGVLLRNVQYVSMIGCYTDANSGPGLEVGNATADDPRRVFNITVTGCTFSKDGGGDQQVTHWLGWDPDTSTWIEVPATDPRAEYPLNSGGHPGVLLRNCSEIRWTGNIIGYGKSFDGGPDVPGPITPTHGVWVENVSGAEIYNSRIDVIPAANAIHLEGDGNYRLAFGVPSHQLMTVPVAGEAIHLPTVGGIGSIAWQNNLGTLVVRDYGGNWRAMVSYLPSSEYVRLPRTVDLFSTSGEGNTALRIVKGGADAPAGGALLRWVVGTNPETGGHTFFIGRYGDDGAGNLEAYVDSPLAILRATGTVETNQLYTRPTQPARAAAQFRGRPGQTGMLTSWEADGGTQVAAVRPDGRIWAQPATATTDLIPLGQLQSVVAASADFADFQARIAAL